jgi:hypothetical protein
VLVCLVLLIPKPFEPPNKLLEWSPRDFPVCYVIASLAEFLYALFMDKFGQKTFKVCKQNEFWL